MGMILKYSSQKRLLEVGWARRHYCDRDDEKTPRMRRPGDFSSLRELVHLIDVIPKIQNTRTIVRVPTAAERPPTE